MWGHTGHTEFLHRKPVTTHVKRLPGRPGFYGGWSCLHLRLARTRIPGAEHKPHHLYKHLDTAVSHSSCREVSYQCGELHPTSS